MRCGVSHVSKTSKSRICNRQSTHCAAREEPVWTRFWDLSRHWSKTGGRLGLSSSLLLAFSLLSGMRQGQIPQVRKNCAPIMRPLLPAKMVSSKPLTSGLNTWKGAWPIGMTDGKPWPALTNMKRLGGRNERANGI
ncbi:hypothetical protein ArV1_024 [Arthrobacter phage vB_ArtM-ArV1]|uniref:Uncharacterized protein n=1 Tax=Arthrobacter phage vB_ArtM-ArV1 TaxID=1566993 RepID=A0A0A7HAL4_9CAUD|nr:hypothetical protein ArV1_024 [Arthrobacter phage vB_ArtM-ArV1]AIZ01712.1 hypothetical protein ArV1_024 [Arthrobacter phage vB_ArtM-ArV1]